MTRWTPASADSVSPNIGCAVSPGTASISGSRSREYASDFARRSSSRRCACAGDSPRTTARTRSPLRASARMTSPPMRPVPPVTRVTPPRFRFLTQYLSNGISIALASWRPMQSWIVLAVAIACEVAGTIFMKFSNSLTRWIWIPPMLIAYVLSLLGLALALRTIEVGIAYAVWAACGTLLIALIGIVFFGESLSLIKVVAIILVIAGVIGLNLADSTAHH